MIARWFVTVIVISVVSFALARQNYDDVALEDEDIELDRYEEYPSDNYYNGYLPATPPPQNDEPIPATASCHSKYNKDHVIQTYSNNANKFIILVATMDGQLQALNALDSGNKLWNLQTDNKPLISSTLNDVEIIRDGRPYRLIPSLDGTLYMYDAHDFQAIPISTESLLGSSLRMGPHVVSGGTQIRAYGVDALNGKIEYSCSMEGCNGNNKESHVIRDRFVIRRKTQTVRAVTPDTGNERWNLSVGEHEISFVSAEGGEMMSEDMIEHMHKVQFEIDPARGIVTATIMQDVIWQVQLESPIAQSWELRGPIFNELSIFDPGVVPSLLDVTPPNLGNRPDSLQSMLYMGIYENQKYVIASVVERERLQAMLAAANMEAVGLGRGDYNRALLARDSSTLFLAATMHSGEHAGQRAAKVTENCGDNCPTCASSEVNALMLTDTFTSNMGWYLYKHPNPPKISKMDRVKRMIGLSSADSRAPLPDSPYFVHDAVVGWGQACALVLCTVVFTVFVMKAIALKRRQPIERVSSTATETSLEPASTISDVRESTPEMRSSISAPSTIITPMNSVEHTHYQSRFVNDFHVLSILGWGGFGVVYVARNNVDQYNYAVKRVKFPRSESEKHKYAREVRTMASYDHPNIVRFHHAWWEEPPDGWQINIDTHIYDKCGGVSKLQSGALVSTSELPSESIAGVAIKFGTSDSLSRDLNKWNFDEQILSASGDPGSLCHSSNVNQCAVCCPSSSSTGSMSFDCPTDKDKSESIIFRDDSGVGEKEDEEKDEIENVSQENAIKPASFMYLYIQMQLCQKDTLQDWLWEHNTAESRPPDIIMDIFAQIVQGVKFVHDRKQIHRDLKPSNIFFAIAEVSEEKEREVEYLQRVVIGDFGLVSKEGKDVRVGCDDTQLNHQHTNRVGTALYMSPEQSKRGVNYTNKVDIYALGLILFELSVPFGTEMERRTIMQQVKGHHFPKDFEILHADKVNLIRKMTSENSDERPSCLELIQHSLLANYCDDNLNKSSKRSRNENSTGSSNHSTPNTHLL